MGGREQLNKCVLSHKELRKTQTRKVEATQSPAIHEPTAIPYEIQAPHFEGRAQKGLGAVDT